MRYFTLPGTGLTVPTVVAGMMRIAEASDADIRTLVDAAFAAGIRFFDHADIYGGAPHHCETRFAQALRLTPAQREDVVLQTKCGIVPGVCFDFSRDHIVASVDGSLRALRTDYLDVLLLHRPDALVEPDEVARAFDELAGAGKVRAFGVSNHTPGQLALLQASVRQPLVANQLQVSITHCPAVAQGIAMNMSGQEQSISLDVGVLDYCQLHDVTVQAWSPFQSGFFTGVFFGSPDYPELNAVIDRLAGEHGVTPEAIATAWLLRHPAIGQVVLGTTTPARVTAAAAGAEVTLTRAQWYELFLAGGHVLP